MQSIIVVGGGISGLMAAYELSLNNKVVLLEASEILGGRIHTLINDYFSMPIELGAEFIHGKLPITLDLLKKAGLKYHAIEGKMFSLKKGKIEKDNQGDNYWNDLMKQMKKLNEDMSLADFLKKYFDADKYRKLRNAAKGFAEGFDLADVSKVSTKFLYNEWSHEDNVQYRVDGGYRNLIIYIESECKKNNCIIHTNCTVKKINWQKDKVHVETSNELNFYADKIVITVPLHVLQADETDSSYIEFNPSINTHINAAKNIGFGTVIKIILEFDEPFWQANKNNVGFIFTGEKVPTWWTQLPYQNAILTGWLGGNNALEFKHAPDNEILNAGLKSLSSAFAISSNILQKKLRAHAVSNWSNIQHIFGGYSYNTVNSVNAKRILNQSINNTIFFAGEAVYNGASIGTVEAALDAGKKAALKILSNGVMA